MCYWVKSHQHCKIQFVLVSLELKDVNLINNGSSLRSHQSKNVTVNFFLYHQIKTRPKAKFLKNLYVGFRVTLTF